MGSHSGCLTVLDRPLIYALVFQNFWQYLLINYPYVILCAFVWSTEPQNVPKIDNVSLIIAF